MLAISHILEYLTKEIPVGPNSASDESSSEQQQGDNNSSHGEQDSNNHRVIDNSKTRNSLLDILTERAYDVSSYTRAAVLKAWIRLTEAGALPKERVIPITKLAMDRLQDKAVIVRKQSMQVRESHVPTKLSAFSIKRNRDILFANTDVVRSQLLTNLLENNPFMGALDPDPYKQKLGELHDWVKANMPEDIQEAHEAALKDAEEEDGDTEVLQGVEQATLATAISQVDSLLADSESQDLQLTEKQLEFCGKVQALKFTQSALEFIDVFEGANNALEGMLLSKNTSDVTETLRFYVRARHFQLPCAVSGMRRSLVLMWSSEKSIRDEVLKAFVDVFIARPGTDGGEPLPEQQISDNLLTVTRTANVSELASIEEAIVQLVKDERLPPEVFTVLWSVVSKGPNALKASAMQLISIGAGADRSILDSKSRLKLLLDYSLGGYAQEVKDWRLLTASAVALQKIGHTQVDPTDAKYLVIERLSEELSSLVLGDWCSDDNREDTLNWFSARRTSCQGNLSH